MISSTIKSGNITIEHDQENETTFYTINTNDLCKNRHGVINGVIEKQDDIFYCVVIDNFWPDDMKVKECETLQQAQEFTLAELNKIEKHYLSKN